MPTDGLLVDFLVWCRRKSRTTATNRIITVLTMAGSITTCTSLWCKRTHTDNGNNQYRKCGKCIYYLFHDLKPSFVSGTTSKYHSIILSILNEPPCRQKTSISFFFISGCILHNPAHFCQLPKSLQATNMLRKSLRHLGIWITWDKIQYRFARSCPIAVTFLFHPNIYLYFVYKEYYKV